METASNHVPSSGKLAPFVFYDFLDGIRGVHVKMAALFQHVGNTCTIINETFIVIRITRNVKADLRKQINSIIDFEEFGFVGFLQHVLK